MANESKIFSTRDLGLASTLVTIGFNVEGIDFQIEGERDRPVGYFKFEESYEVKKVTQDFWSGNLQVEPRRFLSNLHGLKAQIYNIYKSPHIDQSSFKKKV